MTSERCADGAPPIGLIHHLACSGGTIISRALAGMRGVVLLSEQHPEQAMGRRTDPLKQAQAAGAPVSDEDVAARFVGDVAFVARRCAGAGLGLIVRDHANRDFIGTDRCRLVTREVLGRAMRVRSACTVRHPLDTWLGLRAMGWFAGEPAEFLARYEAFARCASELGFERYEDFVGDPDAVLARLCAALGVGFDPAWREGLEGVTHMTGASGRSDTKIGARPRRPVDEETVAAFEREPAYGRSLELLGYAGRVVGEAA